VAQDWTDITVQDQDGCTIHSPTGDFRTYFKAGDAIHITGGTGLVPGAYHINAVPDDTHLVLSTSPGAVGQIDGSAALDRFAYLFARQEGVAACEVCAWDLTRSPEENIADLTAKDWEGVVKNSCFYVEGKAQPLLPKDIDSTLVAFEGCNLDNRVVDPKVEIVGGSHRNIWAQNDRADWVCDWATDAPLEPVNLKSHIMHCLNTDPALIPREPLTDEDHAAQEEQRREAEALHAAGKELVEKTEHVECECVGKSRDSVVTALNEKYPYVNTDANPQKWGKPDPACKVCLGKGARHPALTAETVAALDVAGKWDTPSKLGGGL
jgi:hypothetical protein